MIDRGIGVAGIALALITGLSQYLPFTLPDWFLITGFLLGVLLLGISFGLISTSRRKSKLVDTALLRLHIYNDTRTPSRIAVENIFRWYFLSNIVLLHNESGEQDQITTQTLFVTFEPEVRISTLHVRSPDVQLPVHEVKEFNQRFAIIIFSKPIPSGTLEVSVEP